MYGRNLLAPSTPQVTRVSADNAPQAKPGGITIDWSTVAALGADATNPDGSVIKSGLKYLRYGQVVSKITGGTNTLTSTHTAGNLQLVVTTASPVGGAPSQTTANIAFNATAAQVATAIGLLTNVGAGNVTGSGGPLGTGAVTLVFAPFLGSVSIALGTNTLTGGAFTIGASLTAATNNQGMFGPYDPAATDGRQNLNKGDLYVLDETVLQYGLAGSVLSAQNDQVGCAIEGGLIWIDRVLQSGTAAHTLALGPTLAEITTAFPNFRYVRN
jgi:hypothetical protein